jgi:hypothetical protein
MGGTVVRAEAGAKSVRAEARTARRTWQRLIWSPRVDPRLRQRARTIHRQSKAHFAVGRSRRHLLRCTGVTTALVGGLISSFFSAAMRDLPVILFCGVGALDGLDHSEKAYDAHKAVVHQARATTLRALLDDRELMGRIDAPERKRLQRAWAIFDRTFDERARSGLGLPQ